MSFGILSLSSESIALAKSLGFAFTGLAQDTPKALSLQIKQVLESAAPSVHCLFVDLSKKEDAWEDVDQCVSDLIDSAPDYLKCLVSRHTVATTLNIEPQWWSTIVPEQSCTKKGGEKVAIDPSQGFICSYLHIGSTRCDEATCFTSENIYAHGCNGVILAWHFLAEIGHKLGFVPKYGA